MKRLILTLFLTLFAIYAQAQVNLDYYLPEAISMDESIPTPESVIGYQVGEMHVTHDKLLLYMNEIARISDRAILEVYGKTFENRTLVHLVFTSPENHRKLDLIRKEHLMLCDPEQSNKMNIDNMPVFINLGYSVHGNESSAANSSLLTVYYLAAARGDEIDELMQNAVILVDPCLNPDGLTRNSTWANIHYTKTPVPDPNNRVFNEDWPGGRTNHYWFDLNRDWILLTQPESRARVNWFHQWKPNIVTDHHEMGAGSTFFFQPGISSRNNPLTPAKTFELTKKIAEYHAGGLDKIGSLYYSEERYDDFYYGKGSTYPDINSGIGILFEQAGIRGLARETSNGIITFPFTIKNQFTVTLSSLRAGLDLRTELLDHQRTFYHSAKQEAANDKVKGYLFGDPFDRTKTWHFIDILQLHQIKVYRLKSDVNAKPVGFASEKSYIVPMNQDQYRLIKTLFEKVTRYNDSTFYDVSAWTLPLYFNMPYKEINSVKELSGLMGEELMENRFPEGKVIGGKSTYGYLFKWDEYYAPKVLYAILSHGLRAKAATEGFTCKAEDFQEKFSRGTVFIPVTGQGMDGDEIYSLLKSLAAENGIDIYCTTTGLTPEGIDMGSGSFVGLDKPEILMITGEGINSRDAGEVWHLFDQRYHIPVTMVDLQEFNRINLFRYNILIMVGGSYNGISERRTGQLKEWLSEGNTLLAYKGANEWLNRSKLASIEFKPSEPPDASRSVRYADRSKNFSIQRIAGGFFEVELDLTHPVAYGYHWSEVPVFKTGTLFAEKSRNPYGNPGIYSDNPVLSGFISTENLNKLKGAPFILVHSSGRGTIISILDNTNFRAVCFGTNKIFANAVFFGPFMR